MARKTKGLGRAGTGHLGELVERDLPVEAADAGLGEDLVLVLEGVDLRFTGLLADISHLMTRGYRVNGPAFGWSVVM